MTTNPYPVDSRTRECCSGVGSHTPVCAVKPDLIDLGPAAPPPAWWREGDEYEGIDGNRTWSRTFGPHVWISGWETIIDGRLTQRTTVFITEEMRGEHLTTAEVRERVDALQEAAEWADYANGVPTGFVNFWRSRRDIVVTETAANNGNTVQR